MNTYPLNRSNERRLAQDYAGDVLVWDIDKTYLDTHFSTWRGMLGIPFEAAVDKRAIPGAVELLHGLRHGAQAAPALTPLYFVSASPPQLRGIIERKMVMDDVQYDGITFQDQFRLALGAQFKLLKDHTAYKLTALLLYRNELPDHARYFLFGDDAEADAEIFSLFAEICSGLRAGPLRKRLRARGVPPAQVRELDRLSQDLPHVDVVERIYIHLTRGRSPADFASFGPVLVPAVDFLEEALHLGGSGRLRVEDIARVARAVLGPDLNVARARTRLDESGARLGLPRAFADRVLQAIFQARASPSGLADVVLLGSRRVGTP